MAEPRCGTDGGDTLAVVDMEQATLIDLRGNGGLTGGPAADEMSGGAGNGTLAGGAAVRTRATRSLKGQQATVGISPPFQAREAAVEGGSP